MTCAACGEIAMPVLSAANVIADDMNVRCPRCENKTDLVPTISYLKPGEYESVV